MKSIDIWTSIICGWARSRQWKKTLRMQRLVSLAQTLLSHRYKSDSNLFICLETLHWRHNERDGVSNHQPHDCLLKRLFGRRSMKTSKLRITGLCEGNSPVTGEFPAQRISNAENVSIWWRHHDIRSHTPMLVVVNQVRSAISWPLVFIWIDFNPSMDR